MMIPTQIRFSGVYISHPNMIFVKSIWESIQLYFVISKFVVLSEPFRQPTYVQQEITGTCWDEMLLSFRHMISNICQDWHQYLGDSLHPQEKIFFESIRLNTAQLEGIVILSGPKIWAASYSTH